MCKSSCVQKLGHLRVKVPVCKNFFVKKRLCVKLLCVKASCGKASLEKAFLFKSFCM